MTPIKRFYLTLNVWWKSASDFWLRTQIDEVQLQKAKDKARELAFPFMRF